MNIYALEGHQVKVTSNTIDCGHESDRAKIKEHLKMQKAYTVSYTEVSNYSSVVYLKEFSDVYFNSVNFKDVFEEDHSNDHYHLDWARFNKPRAVGNIGHVGRNDE